MSAAAAEVRCRRGTLGVLPPPLGGRGVVVIARDASANCYPHPPTPPHKGEGSRPSLPLQKAAHLAMDRRVKPGDDSFGVARIGAKPGDDSICWAMTGGTRPVDEEHCRSARGKHCRSGVG
jgi:hypothetical protein